MTEECVAICDAVRKLCTGKGWGTNFTVVHFVDIFKGSEVKKVVDAGHNKIELHGKGKLWNRNDAERLIRTLVMKRYLDEELVTTQADTAASYLRAGPKINEILTGKEKVILTK